VSAMISSRPRSILSAMSGAVERGPRSLEREGNGRARRVGRARQNCNGRAGVGCSAAAKGQDGESAICVEVLMMRLRMRLFGVTGWGTRKPTGRTAAASQGGGCAECPRWQNSVPLACARVGGTLWHLRPLRRSGQTLARCTDGHTLELIHTKRSP